MTAVGSRSPGPACRRRSGRRSRPSRVCLRFVVALRLEAAVASVQENGDRVSAVCSQSPGPACRRRSGRRSRPSRSTVAGWVVAPGLEAAVAGVQEHGDGVRLFVRGHQVRFAVAVQVADRDRFGDTSGWRSRAWPGSCRRLRSGARRRFRRSGHKVGLAVAVQVADRDRGLRPGPVVALGAGSCRRPC